MANVAALGVSDRQPSATAIRYSPQREMPLFGVTKELRPAPDHLVAQCRNRLDAIRLCATLSGLTDDVIAERLGIDKGHWSRIMRGKAYFPDTKSVDFMRLCGNYAPLQYESMALNIPLMIDKRAQRRAELLAELASLDQETPQPLAA